MAEIKLVMFDCDGVLMDSESIATEAELSVYKKYGIELDAAEFTQRFSGSASFEIMKELEKEVDQPFSASMLDEIHEAVDTLCGENAPLVDHVEMVLDLIDQPRCICSNSPQHRLKQMLSRVGLYDRFRPYIYSAKDFDPPRNKPRPDVLEKALGEFETAPQNAVLIEDSVHGVEAGIAAGIRVIGFTGASHTYPGHSDALIGAGAETAIRTMKDLPAMLDALERWEGITG